jgi:hypothetical protein
MENATLLKIGLALFGIGLVPWTVANLINYARHPRLMDRTIVSLFDFRIAKMRRAQAEQQRSMFSDPKSRWFAVAGSVLCALGMVIMIFAANTRNEGAGHAGNPEIIRQEKL